METFGFLPDHMPAQLFTLKSPYLEARITTFGGTIVSLRVPDREGKWDDVVLGFDDLEGYVRNHGAPAPFFFGAIIGRYANRIANAEFELDGARYMLRKNNGEHSLHGGPGGFYNVNWQAQATKDGVELRYVSPDGEEGFPGKLSVEAKYLVSGSELKMQFSATTDKATVVALTGHSYFNLHGHGRSNILDHRLKINASRFTPVDTSLIPTGELRSVSGTPFDFRNSRKIESQDDDPQLRLGKGYDHNFVLDGEPDQMKLAVELFDPCTGRVLTVLTTEPGVQFYSGNYLDGSVRGKNGNAYGKYSGLCLETQHFPDSPNHPEFPTTVLRPGEVYRSETIYRFSVR